MGGLNVFAGGRNRPSVDAKRKAGSSRAHRRSLYCLALASLLVAAVPYGALAAERPPVLEDEGSWTLVMVPDTQYYTVRARNQPILELMTAWIESNIDALNIRMVVQVGDLIERSGKITPDEKQGDQTTRQQWGAVSRAFARLDGKVPYIAATGNHDYTTDDTGSIRRTLYPEYFNVERNHLIQKALVQNGRNQAGEPTLENAALELKDLNGRDYLFLSVEYGPREEALAWASAVSSLPQYADHRTIVVTHEYLLPNGEHSEHPVGASLAGTGLAEPYSLNIDGGIVAVKQLFADGSSGRQVFERLVEPSRNIEMVLSGHFSGEAHRVDRNRAGNPVHQILFDAQFIGGGNGGDGWLRLLEFLPDGRTVRVRTFSPLFWASPATRQLAWKTDAQNEFTVVFGADGD